MGATGSQIIKSGASFQASEPVSHRCLPTLATLVGMYDTMFIIMLYGCKQYANISTCKYKNVSSIDTYEYIRARTLHTQEHTLIVKVPLIRSYCSSIHNISMDSSTIMARCAPYAKRGSVSYERSRAQSIVLQPLHGFDETILKPRPIRR